jgi:hypothetical protein
MSGKTSVTFESLDLRVNERGEIVLAPDRPMRNPTLYMADEGSEVQVEAIFHGLAEIPLLGQRPVGVYRFGHQLGVMVTKDEPIKIVIVNRGPEPTHIGASLVDTPDEPANHTPDENPKGRE